MPPTASLLLIHYFLVLATVNLVITIPTANEYSERLGAGRLLLGIPGGGIGGRKFCGKCCVGSICLTDVDSVAEIR